MLTSVAPAAWTALLSTIGTDAVVVAVALDSVVARNRRVAPVDNVAVPRTLLAKQRSLGARARRALDADGGETRRIDVAITVKSVRMEAGPADVLELRVGTKVVIERMRGTATLSFAVPVSTVLEAGIVVAATALLAAVALVEEPTLARAVLAVPNLAIVVAAGTHALAAVPDGVSWAYGGLRLEALAARDVEDVAVVGGATKANTILAVVAALAARLRAAVTQPLAMRTRSRHRLMASAVRSAQDEASGLVALVADAVLTVRAPVRAANARVSIPIAGGARHRHRVDAGVVRAPQHLVRAAGTVALAVLTVAVVVCGRNNDAAESTQALASAINRTETLQTIQ